MFRKTFLVNVAFVLSALVVVMILVGGCGSSTPVPTATFTPPTPVPTIALTSTAPPLKPPPFYTTPPPPLPPCDPPYWIPFEEIVGATFRYLDSHYPEQKAPIFLVQGVLLGKVLYAVLYAYPEIGR
jgi:hypothetical protein